MLAHTLSEVGAQAQLRVEGVNNIFKSINDLVASRDFDYTR